MERYNIHLPRTQKPKKRRKPKMDSKYLVRTYGPEKGAIMLETDTMSDMDRKMIQSMTKLATSYKAHKDNKVRTIQLGYRPILAVLNTQKPPTPTTPTAPKTTTNRPTAQVAVLICKATKMNGDKCMAKAKQGAFCARHSKKVN